MSSPQQYGPRLFEIALAAVVLFSLSSTSQALCSGCANPSFRSAARSFDVPDFSFRIAAADFNRDGIPDAAVVSGEGVFVMPGTPGGGLGSPSPAVLPYSSPYFSADAGDFDGDGNPDVVVASGDPNFNFFRGNGDGTLQSVITIPSPQNVYRLASGDFNGDGKRDVVYHDETSIDGAIWIRLGDGNGGFGSPIGIPATAATRDFVVADLNGDSIDDVAAANGFANTVSVLAGDSSGLFTTPVRNYVVGQSAQDVAVGDWNHDGRLDLAVTNGEHGISILLGASDGFESPSSLDVAPLNQIVSGDFNGDGNVDLVASDFTSVLFLFAGNGAGGFAAPIPAGIGTIFVPADFNRDGITDLANASSGVAILLGSTSGRFFEFFALGPINEKPVVADFDGNGRLDVIVADGFTGATPLWNEPGGFTRGADVPIGSEFIAAAGDLNGDGRADLITKTRFLISNQIVVYLAFGVRSFFRAAGYDVGSPISVVTGRFNADAFLDVAVANVGSVAIFFGDGAGGFSSQAQFAVGNDPAFMAAEDFNHDSKLDLAVLRFDGTLLFLAGNGTGGFSSITSFAAGANPVGMAAVDVNEDTHRDLVMLTNYGHTLTVLIGNGAGAFAAPSSVPLAGNPTALTVGDINADSHVDLITGWGAQFQTGGIDIHLGNGLGAFAKSTRFFTGMGLATPAAADFDADFLVDVAVSMSATESGAVVFLRNTNCVTRRLALSTDVPSCPTPAAAFTPQLVVRVLDDGENLVSCDAGQVTASIASGTGTPGALLGGTTSVNASGGIASFGNLSVNLAGSGYRLQFFHALAGLTLSRSFSQGLTVALSGPGQVCANAASEYDAGPGYDTYQWTLDANPISRTRRVTLSGLSAGSHVLAVTVTKDGCMVSTNRSINSTSPPSAVVTGPTEVCPYKTGNVASVPDAGVGATYVWTLSNGVVTAGAGTRTITFKVGPSGQTVLFATVTNAQGCSGGGSKTVLVNPGVACPAPVGFFTVTPCRIIDTRLPAGPYGGPSLAGSGIRTVSIAGQCGIASTAKSVVFNVTITNPVALGHLTLFAGNTPVPLTSTINFRSGQTRANNAIVPLGAAGDIAVSSGSSGPVDFILDVNGYFE